MQSYDICIMCKVLQQISAKLNGSFCNSLSRKGKKSQRFANWAWHKKGKSFGFSHTKIPLAHLYGFGSGIRYCFIVAC